MTSCFCMIVNTINITKNQDEVQRIHLIKSWDYGLLSARYECLQTIT